ncbi:MAG: hypothetical protein KC486_18995 [Myxococcales bacterium]|nr:hypothetical protein [Myxococcales bacterium]
MIGDGGERWEIAARGPYPRRSGNAVTPWIDGVPFYERLAAAFRAARSRIWAIVSFIEPEFRFPDGTPWWELLAEAEARGVDVRVLFWRNPNFFKTAHVFLGGARERDKLREWGARWAARWDSSLDDRGHCHHQKAYVVDALTDDPVAFVGGMVLSHATLAEPGHRRGSEKHDAFLELRGPAAADAEHNFVQRWNLANQDPEAPPWPDDARAGPLAYPTRVPARRGDVDVQLCRTLGPGLYPGLTQTPGGEPFDSGAGEATILDHYRGAFAAAQRTIYIENQHPGQLVLLRLLAAALDRGVRVVMVVPGDPMAAIYRAAAEVAALAAQGRADEHRYGPTFQALAALGRRPGFTLVALARSDAAPSGGWTHREIYTHAKLAIVDGAWLTLGSANLVDLSLDFDHSELNASVWGEATAGPLLRTLVAEHGDRSVEAMDDVQALTHLAELARASRASLVAGGPVLAGCYALDPARYGLDAPLTRRLGEPSSSA